MTDEPGTRLHPREEGVRSASSESSVQKLRPARPRVRAPWRARLASLRRTSGKLQVVGWICACCLPLALLGAVQLAWIGHVSESQRKVAQSALSESLRLVSGHFRDETKLLLTNFGPDLDLDPGRRSDLYLQRYLAWNDLSRHGHVLKRILFWDPAASGSAGLTQLDGVSRRLVAADRTGELEHVIRHLDEFGFQTGQRISSIWLSTWMFHPQGMAVFRPMVKFAPDWVLGTGGFAVTGYLILQLDMEVARDHLIPAEFDDHLAATGGEHHYALTISLDGKSLYAYGPTRFLGVSEEKEGARTGGYEFSQPHERPAAGWTGEPDFSLRLLLDPDPIPDLASQRGAVQRVSLHNAPEISRVEEVARGLMRPGASERVDAADLPVGVWTASPRLFLIASRPLALAIEARHVGAPFEEVINSRYRRSVALGTGLIMLFAGVAAIVIATTKRAARVAEARMRAASSQAHQLRTPIAAIVVLADNMARGMLGSGEKVIEYGALMREYGRQLAGIVDRTMELFVVGSSEEHHRLALLDVAGVVSEALAESQPLIDGAGFTLEHSRADTLPRVRADAEDLRQSVVELLSNAVKYGLPGRWVRVETADTGGGVGREVQIRVHDRGPGIPRAESDRIFEAYYRVASDADSSIPGSGLGLHLARKRVRAMGGRLTLSSELGRGSLFTIHLPCVS